jgi:type III pantothenate kinase
VVATDVGDCREVIGEGGQVVPPADPAALAGALGEVLHPSTRRARGRAAQERAAREYGAESWVRRIEQVYERAASGSTP